ncbi:hypothetical protein TPA0910_26040 [Streptomyces hygroscopicus subsp. sporocinereus]|uniref:Uncharacterized protein n=1 Tax=Streptomyces hygroscopicus TaxID=1912 RepID=A0ABQ3TYI5_STRHY|nr:hypothetical protein TPA0910_26040 [Streptomyces hygroscopicus]
MGVLGELTLGVAREVPVGGNPRPEALVGMIGHSGLRFDITTWNGTPQAWAWDSWTFNASSEQGDGPAAPRVCQRSIEDR